MTVTLASKTFFDRRRRWFDRWLDRLLRRPPVRIEVGLLSPLQRAVADGLMRQGVVLTPDNDGPFVVYVDNLPPGSPHPNGFYQVQMRWYMPGTKRHSG